MENNKKLQIYSAFCLLILTACNTQQETAENHLQKGKEYFETGEFDKALLELKSSTQDEMRSETYYYLALLYEKRSNFVAMRDNLLKAVELDPGYVEARVKLAKVHFLFSDFDKALEQTDRILTLQPDNVYAQLIKATIFVKQNKNAEAEQIITSVLHHHPDNVEALALKANQLYQQIHFAEALSIVARVLNIDSKNVPMRLLRIEINTEQNNTDAVIADYQEFIQLYPDDENFRLSLASIYVWNNNLPATETVLREMIDKNPASAQPKILLLQFFNARAKERLEGEYEQFLASKTPMTKQWLELSSWMFANGYPDLAEKGLKQVIAAEKNGTLGFVAQTLKTLKRLVAGEKDSAISLNAQILLGEIALNKKQYAVVETLVDHMLKNNSDFVEASLLNARLLLVQNNPDAAIESLNKVAWTKSDSDKAYFLLGEAYAAKQDRKQAENNFRQALDINPANIGAFLPVYNSLLAAHQTETARQLLEKALTALPYQEVLLTLKAEMDIADKHWDDARKTVSRLILFSKNKVLPSYFTANILQDTGHYAEAIAVYEKLLERFPEHLYSLVNLVKSFEALNSRNKAIAYLEAHHAKYPEDMNAVGLLGSLYINNLEYVKAKTLFTEQIKLMPKQSRLYLDLARIEAQAAGGSPEAAKNIYLKGLENVPDDPLLTKTLGEWYDQTGDKSNARKTYERLLELQPANDAVANDLAFLLTETGNAEDAVKGRALSEKFKNVENPNYQDTYAWALVKTGHAAEGLKLLETMLLKEPKSPVLRYHLGTAYFKTGNIATAIVELKKALSLSEKEQRDFAGKNEAKKLLLEIEHPAKNG